MTSQDGGCPHLQSSNRHPRKWMNMNMPSSHTAGCHESQIGTLWLYIECNTLYSSFKLLKRKLALLRQDFQVENGSSEQNILLAGPGFLESILIL